MGLFDDFMGKSQKRDIQQGAAQARAALGQAYGEANSIYGDYLGKGVGYLQPGMQRGEAANKLLADALGINGRDAQASYYQQFQTDPGFQASLQAGLRGVEGSAAARGGLYSGAAMKGLQDYGQRAMYGQYQDRLKALSGVGQVGDQMSGMAAGFNVGAGKDLSNLRYGYGQGLANNLMSEANAMAASRGVGMNNLLNLAGTLGGSAFKAAMGPV